MNPGRIITLTTDFGLADAYVGIMKGVILGIAPGVTTVDISHEVRPQNVSQAAYLLTSAYRYFPPDTVHVGVVDPGVGTARKAIAVQAPYGVFVGPDNGIFCPVLADQRAFNGSSGQLAAGSAVELTNDRYWRQPVSRTFHGRDIFAPVAAHLAEGIPLAELGAPLHALHRPPGESAAERQGVVHGVIIHIDRFGNAISNVPQEMVPAKPVFEVAGRVLEGLATSYQDAPVVAIVGSTGLVEIAARNASAVERLGLNVFDALLVRSAS